MTVVHKVILFVLATIGITWVSRSSLLFLGWGIFLKSVNWIGVLLAVLTRSKAASVFTPQRHLMDTLGVKR